MAERATPRPDAGARRSNIGAAIRATREAAGTSRRALAEAAGLSYSYLSEIENGAKEPSTHALLLLANALGTRRSQLFLRAEAGTEEARDSGTPSARAPRSDLRADHPEDHRADLSEQDISTPRRDGRGATGRSAGARRDARRPEARSDPGTPGPIPESLVRAIERGTCVAFVGAGFSGAASLPGWSGLVSELATAPELAPDVRAHVLERVAHGTAHAFDEATQLLEDRLGRSTLLALLRERLGSPAAIPAMQQRMEWLHGIPFHAILTTNFDGLLQGAVPESEAYRAALRRDATAWWSQDYWTGGPGAFTLKLHGDLSPRAARQDEVVLTRRDYRRRLYEDPAYQTFLRSVMATRTVLYMGFSFEDAYLNELRSEILALVGQEPDSAPISYAIANDVPLATQEHFRANEGIEILPYDSRAPGEGPGRADGAPDHAGFDRYLAAIYAQTSPLEKFARHLAQKRILWVDPHPENNELAFVHLRAAAQRSGNATSLQLAGSAEEGLAHLGAPGDAPYLVITHWGENQARDGEGKPVPTAVRLLSRIRREDHRTPVVIFASNRDADRRKHTALGLGAQAYCFHFDALYREIQHVLAPATETG